MNAITVPVALLVTGYAAPGVCVRHGEPAVFRRGFGSLVKNWPFCARCRTRRWTLMALAVAAAFVPFVVGFGLFLLWAFTKWQGRRERSGRDPLVHLALVRIPPLRSGLTGLFSQNLILMGVFFTIPLYLQLVIGLNALETGVRMLPVSIAMFIASAAGSRLSARYPVRSIVRAGLVVAAIAAFMLLGTIEPALDNSSFAWSMAV